MHDTLQYLLDKYHRQRPAKYRAGRSHIVVQEMHRDTLGTVFAELGFTTGVEIGTLKGDYAAVLCRANSELHLFCVDPWGQFDDTQDYTIPAVGRTHDTYEQFYRTAAATLAPYPNVTLLRKTSMAAVRDFDDNMLDFVYIDGNHELAYITEDLEQWSRKVRPGGIIAGHDYVKFVDPVRALNDVKAAVDAYVHAHQISPWFLIDRPRSRRPKAFHSFLWVKE